MNRYFCFSVKKSWINLLLLLYLICYSFHCKKERPDKKELPQHYNSYVRMVEKYFDNNQPDSAYFYLSRLKKYFPALPQDVDSTMVGLPNTLLGFYFEDNNQPDSALFYHQLAYQDKLHFFGDNHPELSKSINNLGLLFQKISSFKVAEIYFSKAITLVKNNYKYCKEYTKYTLNLSNNYYLLNDFNTSLSLLNNLTSDCKEENAGNIYLAKANNYMSLKQFKKAVYFYNLAYPLFNFHSLRKAQLANNLGNAYSNLNQESIAISYYKKALDIRNGIENTSNNELGEVHTNFSTSYLKQNKLEMAYKHLVLAKKYYLKNNPVNQLAISNLEDNFGLYHLKKFDVESALKHYEQSQFLHDSILGTPSIENGNRYLTLAHLYLMPPFRDTAKGLFYLNKMGNIEEEIHQLGYLLLKSSISINQKKFKEAKIGLTKIIKIESRISFETPLKQIEVKLQIAAIYEKLNEIKASRYIKNQAIELIHLLPVKNDIHYFQNRLHYELIEIQILLKENKHLMASKMANNIYLWIDSLQSAVPILKRDRISNEFKSSILACFFQSLSNDKTALLHSFYYPYKKNKFPRMMRHSLFIRYSVTQDKIYIWTEYNGKKDVLIKDVDISLEKAILSIRNAIREMPQAGEKSKVNYKDIYQNLVQKLSILIIPEIPSETERIVFSPDHILSVLPFEILVNPKNNDKRLIEKYPISYHFMTHEKIDQPSRSLKQKVLAFSPDFQKDTRGYANLKYSESEIEKISGYLPTSKFTKNEASANRFKKEAPHYRWIHIATHGDPNLNSDEGGALIFSEKSDKKEPSILYASEISNLNIRANLVVLSACQSSIGHYTPSQGMNSIAQAFLNAGATSVVTSLWQVDDKSTAQFMDIFYHYLSKGYPKNKALQLTKMNMINKMPYYWAPFILIGETGDI